MERNVILHPDPKNKKNAYWCSVFHILSSWHRIIYVYEFFCAYCVQLFKWPVSCTLPFCDGYIFFISPLQKNEALYWIQLKAALVFCKTRVNRYTAEVHLIFLLNEFLKAEMKHKTLLFQNHEILFSLPLIYFAKEIKNWPEKPWH